MDKVRIGIIGCGGIANGKHMPALKKLPDVEMVAFCDIIEERAVKAAAEYGVEGAKDFIVRVVEEAGPNPCPPIVVGVGIGGTFDKCALLAKKALMRSTGERNPDPYYAALEAELLARINALGVGPQGFGGKTTALAVNIETAPTHIAGLPVAVNINCHVTRHKSEVL